MLNDRIAKRYAASIYGLGKERGELQALHNDFTSMHTILQGSREVRAFLKLPLLSAERKRAILKKLFTGRVSTTTLLFLDILARHGREAVLGNVAVEFLSIYKHEHNIATVQVRTATALTAQQRSLLTEQLKAQLQADLELEEKVDPSLIGGLVLRQGDRQFDSSIAGALQRLQQQFKDITYQEQL